MSKGDFFMQGWAWTMITVSLGALVLVTKFEQDKGRGR